MNATSLHSDVQARNIFNPNPCLLLLTSNYSSSLTDSTSWNISVLSPFPPYFSLSSPPICKSVVLWLVSTLSLSHSREAFPDHPAKYSLYPSLLLPVLCLFQIPCYYLILQERRLVPTHCCHHTHKHDCNVSCLGWGTVTNQSFSSMSWKST